MFGLNISLSAILPERLRSPRVLTGTKPAATAISLKPTTATLPRNVSSLPPGQRFAFVDALRGLAALGVAAYHIFRYGPLATAAEPVLPGFVKGALHHGWIGVQVFFVISGFVIAYALRNAWMTPSYFKSFAIQRSLRLGPPYWCTILFVLGLQIVASSLMKIGYPLVEEMPSWQSLATHTVYLQNVFGFTNISVGFWTLCIEMQFYLLFALLLGAAQQLTVRFSGQTGKTSALALSAMFLPIAIVSLFWLSIDGGRTDMWAPHFFIYFVLGATVFWTLDGRMPKAILWGLAAAILVRQEMHWTLDLCVGGFAALAIYVCGRSGNLGNWLNFAWLQRLGLISYSLYLIHYPISWIISTLGYEITGSSPVAAVCWLLLGLAASLGVAHVMHEAIEVPAIRLAHRFKPSHSARPTASSTPPASATPPVDPRPRRAGGQIAPGLAS